MNNESAIELYKSEINRLTFELDKSRQSHQIAIDVLEYRCEVYKFDLREYQRTFAKQEIELEKFKSGIKMKIKPNFVGENFAGYNLVDGPTLSDFDEYEVIYYPKEE